MFFSLYAQKAQEKSFPILASVEGDPMSMALFVIHIEKELPKIFNEFLVRYTTVKMDSAFWVTPIEGEAPFEIVKRQAFDSTLRTFVKLQIFRGYGLIEDIGFENMNYARLKENQRRSLAFKNNEVIAGPRSYTAKSYFDFIFNNLESKYHKHLADTLFLDQHKLKSLHQGSFFKNQPLLDVKDRLLEDYYTKQYDYILQETIARSDIKLNTKLYVQFTYSEYLEWKSILN